MSDRKHVVVDCQDCLFAAQVAPDDEVAPADLLIDHGRETGHKLTVTGAD